MVGAPLGRPRPPDQVADQGADRRARPWRDSFRTFADPTSRPRRPARGASPEGFVGHPAGTSRRQSRTSPSRQSGTVLSAFIAIYWRPVPAQAPQCVTWCLRPRHLGQTVAGPNNGVVICTRPAPAHREHGVRIQPRPLQTGQLVSWSFSFFSGCAGAVRRS